MSKIYTATMFLFVCALFISTNVQAAANCPANPDPCTNYRALDAENDYTRSIAYNNFPAESYLGDGSLIPAWYRATSPAGGNMPTENPGLGFCQALAPVYLPVQNVAVAVNGISQATACADLTMTCVFSLDICIKECQVTGDTYTVYYLTRPTTVFPRYCFGTELPCPDGQQSATGFTPCVAPPVPLQNDPTIVVDNSPQNFLPGVKITQPEFHCSTVHNQLNLLLEFRWTVAGTLIKTEQLVNNQQPAVLTQGDMFNNGVTMFGIMIECEVTTVAMDGSYGDVRTAEFFVGLSATTTQMTLRESGQEVMYIVDATAPFSCIYFEAAYPNPVDVECKIALEVRNPENNNANNGGCIGANSQVVFRTANTDSNIGPCEMFITVKPFVAGAVRLEIPIRARQDDTYDGTKEFALQMRVKDRTGELFGELDLFSFMHLPRVQVTVVDDDVLTAGKRCYARLDPHMKSFDGRYYEGQYEGVFRMYRQITGIPIEVQAFFKSLHRPHWTDICGIAVRSFGELYVNNQCDSMQPAINQFYECDLQNVGGVGVQSLRVVQNGNTYTIHLPTGGRVEFSMQHIYIYPGLSDFNNTEGACGNFNDNGKDDFTLRDGTTFDGDGDGIEDDDGQQFFLSHRVGNADLSNTLFDGHIGADDREFQDVVFCGCDGTEVNNQATDLHALCGPTPAVGSGCVSVGNDVTDLFKRHCGLSKKRSAEYSDDVPDDHVEFRYDPDFKSPEAVWFNGWSEPSAHKVCTNAFNRPSVRTCADTHGIDIVADIETCILDIKISGSRDYVLAGIDSILNLCMNEISRNITLQTVEDKEGNVINLQEQLLTTLCPVDCNDRGVCRKGICICEEGYTSFDCSEDEHYVPTIFDLPSSAICDHFFRPCKFFTVYGDNFIDNENLTCKLQVLDTDSGTIENATIIAARFEHNRKVFCPILSSFMPYNLSIQVSNDGESFSNARELLIYDSTCWDCNAEDGCTKKDLSCIIAGECYGEDEPNPKQCPDYINEFCKPQKNEFTWTYVPVTSDEPTGSTASQETTDSTASQETTDSRSSDETTDPPSYEDYYDKYY